jgi:hypothetical protein
MMSAENKATVAKPDGFRYRSALVVLAFACGILAANPFADAAGIPRPRGQFESIHQLLRGLCGLVVFLVIWLGLPILVNSAGQLATLLGKVRSRPPLPAAIVLIACGTLCVLGAVMLAWNVTDASAQVPTTVPIQLPQVRTKAAGTPALAGPSVASGIIDASAPVSLLRVFVTFASLVIGVGLIAIGIWSTMETEEEEEEAPEPVSQNFAQRATASRGLRRSQS